MIKNPASKYQAFNAIDLPDRQWPSRTLTQAPIWMSTDLRDGNQALIEPMDAGKKLKMFQLLLSLGVKEIEVAFPSASQTDFDFVRQLIEQNLIPADVTIEVLTQGREDLIRRTIDSLAGAKRAIVHLYNPIALAWRKIVFNTDQNGVKQIALSSTRLIKELTAARPETEWVFQYSPETFSAAEIDFAKEVCDAVADIWQPTATQKMIINLPATVEMATPNTYADQIEWMHRHLVRRDSIVLSVHPHNDRGTAVAAAELALMAGADRVEGCLFGSGERTGNVDLVILALNLYSQGIAPGLDFSDIDHVRQVAEFCTQLPVHPRHPYGGDLVFTAFSGSHQDAIKKGLAQQQPDAIWQVPYLPIDPADVGRNYDAVIRVNSQSGKGGVSYVLQQEYGFELPRRMQIEFSRAIQRFSDNTGKEVKASDLYQIFCDEYLFEHAHHAYRYVQHSLTQAAGSELMLSLDYEYLGQRRQVTAHGNGPIEALTRALNCDLVVLDYHEHAIGTGADASAACYVEIRYGKQTACHGMGLDHNLVSAAIKAVFCGLNRSQITVQ